MSLRVRLVLLIVVLVALVTVALSAWYLDNLVNSVSADALDRSELASQQVKAFVIDQINRHARDYDAPGTLEETTDLWNKIVSSDADISSMLEKMLGLSAALVEINIAGQTGSILASSNPSKIGKPLTQLENFDTWKNRSFFRRMRDLVKRLPDDQVNVPLGFAGSSTPIFTIQVVASMVLLRSGTLLPQLQGLVEVSGAALLVSLFLTVLGTNRVLRPLKHIEQTIDRIVQGNYRGEEKNVGMAKEFAAVESKLNILGQQFRGAREEATGLQHNLAQVLERMASQLDVASRLAAISRITGGVAHEIKNPLNAISLRLDLLRARLGAPEEELQGEFDILSKEVRRLDRVVKTFLDFSRPVEVKFQELDVAELTREVTELMTPSARLANIAISFEAYKDPVGGGPLGSTWIRGDADMLKQAILNLVTNAQEALRQGGHLWLRVAPGEEYVTLEIADDGPGIPPELREKVFQLYFTTKSTGSGIGLAMTFRAVQLHNGTIDFTSDKQRGTTFRLQFPTLVGHA